MASDIRANDWEFAGVAQLGGEIVLGGGINMFEVRSRRADFRGQYIFAGLGLGAGAGFSGASAPSPGEFRRGRAESPFGGIRCDRDFSADDLHLTSGRISSGSISPMYGYGLMAITAYTTAFSAYAPAIQLLLPCYFHSVDVSGWGVGVAANVGIIFGQWIRLGGGRYY